MATLTTLANFSYANGANPFQGLFIDSSGNLIGTTEQGGAAGDGTIFEIAKTASGYANAPTTVATFNGVNGSLPLRGSLIADSAGDLFGTTSSGGVGFGTVFEITYGVLGYSSTPTVLVTFNGPSGNGASPQGSLSIDSAGDLFGTTAGSGSNDGTVFEITKSVGGYAGLPTTIATFNGTNGSTPQSGLITDAAGDLFGTTNVGGANNDGTVFEIQKNGSSYASTPTTLVSLAAAAALPQSGLVMDSAGNLFGTTTQANGAAGGTVFEIAKTSTGYASTPTILATFSGANGINPQGSLIIDANGDLFGTLSTSIFEIAKVGGAYVSTPTIVASLSAATNGTNPGAGVVADSSGNLLATTSTGGANNDGTAIEVTNSGYQLTSTTQPTQPVNYVPLVDAYYQGILRFTPPTSVAQTFSDQLNAGTLTTNGLITGLLGSAQATSLPALLSYDFVYGVAPASSGLTYLSNYAADLQSGNYTYTGGFQLGTSPGQYSLPQFSVLNTYVNLCATGAINPSPFNSTYGSLAASATTANRTTFFNEVYNAIFGFAPAASTTSLFVTQPAAANPSITTFQYYVNYAGSELGGYGAIAGVLLYTAETSNLGQLPTSAAAFLSQAATSTAAGADTAPYGTSLLTSFPASAPITPATSSDTAASAFLNSASAATVRTSAASDAQTTGNPTVIVAGPGNSTLVGGAGAEIFSFADGTASTTTITGFDPSHDSIQLTNGFSAAGVASILSTATATSGGTALVLPDGTHITLAGIAPGSLTANSIFAS